MSSRRTFIESAITVAGLTGASRLLGMTRPPASDRPTNSTPLPVITPDVKDLPFAIENGVKVFQLTAEPIKRKIAPWKPIDSSAFNRPCPGPTPQRNHGAPLPHRPQT